MSSVSTAPLFLNDLHISGFRGINELCIPKLGRVTLLAGDNGVGKTSVLEAVQVYAARGIAADISYILSKHDEVIASRDEDGDKIFVSDPTALFFGRHAQEDSTIKIGPLNGLDNDILKIEWTIPAKNPRMFLESSFDRKSVDYSELMLKISFANQSVMIPWILQLDEKHERNYFFKRLKNFEVEGESETQYSWPEVMEFQLLGPGLVSNTFLQELWKEIALTDDEDQIIDTMQMVVHETIQRVGIGVGERTPFGNDSGIIIRFKEQEKPVPLRSLGDGAFRLFSVALALVTTHNGFVAIDEVENGIHYSHHFDFWRIIFKLAKENNIQILATTHSFDCIKGFAEATLESKQNEGVLVRLDRDKEKEGIMHANMYEEDKLESAAENGIEVR